MAYKRATLGLVAYFTFEIVAGAWVWAHVTLPILQQLKGAL